MTWKSVPLPEKLSAVRALTTAPNGTLWLGGREGAFYSDDHGRSWKTLSSLPITNIGNVDWDDTLKRVVITSTDSTMVFALNSDDKTWKWWDAGWKVRMVHSLGGRLVAASLYDGIVVEPADAYSPVASLGAPAQK